MFINGVRLFITVFTNDSAFLHGIHDCHEAEKELCVDFFILDEPEMKRE